MNRFARVSALAYGVSLAALAAAVLVRWLLDPVLGDTLPLTTLFAAIAVAVWIGGYRPALLVAALGFLACDYLFIPPRGQLRISDSRDFVGLILFLATTLVIIGFGQALRRAQLRSRTEEDAAREQAALLRITLGSIGDGVIATDADGRVTTMNAIAQTLTGWTNEQAAGLPLTQVFRIVNQSTRLEVENPVLRALKEGVIVGLANHTLLIATDGTERPIDDSAAPIRRSDGQIIGCVLVFRDITDRYQAEAEQREARQQIVATLESVTDGFMRYDKDWRIVYVNAEAERINRLTRAEMLGRNVWEVFPALVGTHFEAEFRRAVAEQTTVEFENHYEPFGRWYSLKGYPTADGGLTTFIRDITTQKESENALRASEERLAFVRRSSGVGFWYCDLPFDVLQWDELVKAHFHLPPDASVTIETFYDRIHPDDREPTRLAIERSIADRTHYDTEYRTVNPHTGAVTWVRAIGRTFYAADGTPMRFDGVTLDVSDQKRAEQEVVRIAAESERQRRLYETVLSNTPDFVYVFSLDHKVLYANEALIKMWGRGVEGAIGKTFLEIGYEPWHAQMHDREIDQVRATRAPIRGEVPFNGTNGRRQYDYIFVPVIGADGQVEAVAGTTRDVTERHQAEAALRESEERQAFLIRLADTLRPLFDPIVVQAEASRVLGEYVGANRVVYFEIRGDEYVVERDYTAGVRPLAGRYPVSAFGPALLAALLEGRTVIEADATLEPGRAPGEREAFAAIQVRGHVDVPLVKNGRFVAGMTVHLSERRDWTLQEVALIEETAERTWAAVERVRAEVALHESDARYRAVVEGQSELVCRFRVDGTILFANSAYARSVGSSKEALEGSDFWSLIPAADRASVKSMLDGLTPDAPELRIENRFVTRDGERWMLWTNRGLRFDSNGRVLEAQSAGIDITDRKKAETALRQSEEGRRLALDAAELGTFNIDPATNTLTCDERFRIIFAGSTAELDYEQAFAAVHPDDRERIRDAVAATTRSDDPAPYAEEYRVIHSDGSIRWISAKGRANFAGLGSHRRLVSFDGTVADITARKEAEVRVRESEQRFRLMADAAPVMIWMSGTDKLVNWYNQPWLEFTGRTMEQEVGNGATEVVHPDDLVRTLPLYLAAFEARVPFSMEYRLRRYDGEFRWMVCNGVPRYRADGQFEGYIGSCLDVTDYKNAEAALREADRRKDEFLATLAHELRNPLAPIHNGLQVMRLAGVDGTIEEARAMMERQLTQLVRLVDDLLEMSRVTSGKLELRKERVELKAVIDAAVETSRPAIEQAGHELAVVVPEEPILLDGDAIRLSQVVSNLLNNSAKYTHSGGHIRLTVRREHDHAIVVVADDGIGIPTDMLDKVFEMFAQVDRALEKTTGGLGIGLSLVKGLVEMHGGTIEARSEGEGRGSEFIVCLPVVLPAAENGEPPSRDRPACAPGRRRILVADDNVDSAESLGKLLRLLGNDVSTANDGMQALDAAETSRPDVIVLDIGMTRLNGYEACRRIRELPWGKQVILVAMTGWGQDEDKRRSHEAGFDHHLVKPVDFKALEKLLASLKAEKA